MANMDIRTAMFEGGVSFWEVAEKMGKSQSWLSVKLRKELPPEEKEKIMVAIEEAKK